MLRTFAGVNTWKRRKTGACVAFLRNDSLAVGLREVRDFDLEFKCGKRSSLSPSAFIVAFIYMPLSMGVGFINARNMPLLPGEVHRGIA